MKNQFQGFRLHRKPHTPNLHIRNKLLEMQGPYFFPILSSEPIIILKQKIISKLIQCVQKSLIIYYSWWMVKYSYSISNSIRVFFPLWGRLEAIKEIPLKLQKLDFYCVYLKLCNCLCNLEACIQCGWLLFNSFHILINSY